MPVYVRRYWRRIRFLTSQPHWWAEVWSAIVLIAWGTISIFLPSINLHHYFNAVVSVASEEVWERLVLAAGMFQLVALILNKWQLKALGAFFSTALLATFLYCFVFSGKIFPSVAFYGGYAGINTLAMYMNIVRRDV